MRPQSISSCHLVDISSSIYDISLEHVNAQDIRMSLFSQKLNQGREDLTSRPTAHCSENGFVPLRGCVPRRYKVSKRYVSVCNRKTYFKLHLPLSSNLL